MLARALPDAVQTDEGLRAALLNLVATAEDYEELESGLAELLGRDLDQSALTELLAEVLVAAQMYGRFTAQEEGHVAL